MIQEQQEPGTRICARCGQSKPLAVFDKRFVGKECKATCASCRGWREEPTATWHIKPAEVREQIRRRDLERSARWQEQQDPEEREWEARRREWWAEHWQERWDRACGRGSEEEQEHELEEWEREQERERERERERKQEQARRWQEHAAALGFNEGDQLSIVSIHRFLEGSAHSWGEADVSPDNWSSGCVRVLL